MPRYAILGAVLLLLLTSSGCAKRPAGRAASSPASAAGTGAPGASAAPSGDDEGTHVEKKTVVEQLPDGSTRTTVITRTTSTRTIEAPSPPPRPADPWPADPLVKYNIDLLNHYRAGSGLAPLVYDAGQSTFALAGSQQLASDHAAHAHFEAATQAGAGVPGFGTHLAENQGDPNGVRPMAPDAVASGKLQIALLLKLMFDEGPGGGHYDNMMSAKSRRVGVGLYSPGGVLYLTNDFSD